MKKPLEVLSLAAVLVLAFALRYTEPYYLADLAIVPDSAQYAVAGYNLAHGRGLWIYINDLRLPLMYPCGFPLILALYYLLTGAALHTAIYLVLAFSLASIVLAYLFARSVFGCPTALLAALFLSVAPSYVGYSQVLISDMVSNTFMIAGLWLAWMAAVGERKTSRLWFAAGALCGFSTAVHIMRIITLLPLCATCLIGSRRNIRCQAISLAYLVAGFVVGISPVLMYNGMAFGDIFKTGYYYWERWEGGKDYFSLHYAIRNTAVSERGDQRGNIVYYLWHFFGLSWPTLFAPYFPAVLLLAIFGVAGCVRQNRGGVRFSFAVMILSLIFGTLFMLLFYAFQMAKFFLPVVPFVCMLAANGTVMLLGVFRGGSVSRRLLLRVPVAILLAVTAWGCAKPFMGGDLTHHAPTWWYEGFKVLNQIAPDDAFLISGIDGVYVTHYFIGGTHRTYMPISREVEYIRQRDLPLKVAMENPGYIRSLLASGKRVYMDGFTFNWWARYRAALEKDFNFVPVTSYYNGSLRLYELRPKSTS
ncbi:MAG: glycosyltransferase family 39 protein [Candidatus Aureabacteria bacterium]|nr:glycosyltransferase family 39 protein [Candidatus Auribacterota bacterium]